MNDFGSARWYAAIVLRKWTPEGVPFRTVLHVCDCNWFSIIYVAEQVVGFTLYSISRTL
jgi:hypothetical protein